MELRGMRWVGHLARIGTRINTKFICKNLKEKYHFGDRGKYDDIIKIGSYIHTRCDSMDWIQLAHNRFTRPAVVKMVINLRVP
jgi:hypothetical protein